MTYKDMFDAIKGIEGKYNLDKLYSYTHELWESFEQVDNDKSLLFFKDYQADIKELYDAINDFIAFQSNYNETIDTYLI